MFSVLPLILVYIDFCEIEAGIIMRECMFSYYFDMCRVSVWIIRNHDGVG